MVTRLFVATTLMLALAGAAFGADSGNLQTFRAVQKPVLQYPHFTIFDTANVQVDNGSVKLTGKVTLDGVVLNEADRAIARSIAGGFPAFSSTNHLRTEAEVERALEQL